MRIGKLLAVYAATWIIASFLLFPNAIGAPAAANADPERGRQLFEKRCTGCHSLDKNKEGPRLRGVYGRRSGSIPDFTYSDPLKASNIVWDERSLNEWLTNPETVVRDNDMAFHVSNAEERASIIQFLRAASGK
jgi:cytochrome c